MDTEAKNELPEEEAGASSGIIEESTEGSAVNRPVKSRKKTSRAALTINFYSWSTPIIGLAMLVVGLLAGYFGRPLLDGASPAPVTAGTTSAGGGAANLPPNNASSQEVMDFIISQVRHFRGAEDAPITMVEFGDFQ